ncbi:MAG: LysE family translocator [Burkholderiales bacterium]|nr:LysE family translocator [Burkholderiales bacterium]
MLEIKSLIPLIVFCFSTSITPGPNNLMIMLSGISFGLKRSLPHYFGILCGFAAMGLLLGIGLGHVFEKFPILHIIAKYVGAIYMLYLAWSIATSDPHLKEAKKASKPISFFQAALFQWVNPKTWIILIGVIAAYTTPNLPMIHQVVIILIVYFLIGIFCVGAWLVSGITLRKFLRNPSYMRKFNLTMGALLALSIILMIFE